MLRLSRDERWGQTCRNTLDGELRWKEEYGGEVLGDCAVGGRSGGQTGWMTRGSVGRGKGRLKFRRQTVCKTHTCRMSPRIREKSRRVGRARRRIQGNGLSRVGRTLRSGGGYRKARCNRSCADIIKSVGKHTHQRIRKWIV